MRRSKIILMSANGYSNTAIAERLGISAPTVSLWRRRFLAHRIVGICSTQSPCFFGRPVLIGYLQR
ncbi:MAG: helix-turn-helix domain-containing protein [bacterium]